jgi:hypothetical protein
MTDNHNKTMQTDNQSTEGKDPQQTASESSLDGAACSPYLSDALAWAESDGSDHALAWRLEKVGKWGSAGDNALEIVAKEYRNVLRILQDPVAVHINMLRGTIAWTPEHLRHVLGDPLENAQDQGHSPAKEKL